MSWLLARLMEPSTWAGLALFATSAQNVIQSGNVTVQSALAAFGGFLATIMSEKS